MRRLREDIKTLAYTSLLTFLTVCSLVLIAVGVVFTVEGVMLALGAN